jgi:carbon monoxide dehydrogenase subunit G
MELKDTVEIAASPSHVFAALNNPEILRASIPGCEELTQVDATTYDAVAVVKIGPIKASFRGRVNLDVSNAPASFSLTGEGNGGVAGFAKGGASVTLDETPAGTRLSYDVDAQIGGKLAQLGNRLIVAAARTLVGKFFTNFSNAIAAQTQRAS